MAMFTASKCPRCGEMAVFPCNKKVVIDGELMFPLSVKCSKCKWEPTDEQVIAGWKTGVLNATGVD